MASGGFQYIDILLFAVVAGFLLLRLRSVLGRRTGNEQRRDPFAPPRPPVTPPPGASPFRGPTIEGTAVPVEAAEKPTGLAAIKAADPAFTEDAFLKGARGAFEIIINAFAAGDAAALRPLLAPQVFDSFAKAITARQAAEETVQNTLVSIKSAEIAEANREGDTALVTVKFLSEQSNAVRDKTGKVIDGDPERVVEHSDSWTFSRSLRARDPNWTLVATGSP